MVRFGDSYDTLNECAVGDVVLLRAFVGRLWVLEAGQNVSLPDASRPMDALYPTPPALSPRGLEAGAE